jgi:glycosyltransferase involved in cell wall biosynthesis
MRVVHLIARFNQGGTATWLATLIEGQRACGDNVWLLAGEVQSGEREDPRFKEINGLRIHGFGRKISLIQDVKAIFLIRKQLQSINPDVINTHTAKAGMVGRVAAWSLGKNRPRIVHTYHGHVLYGYFGRSTSLVFNYIERILANITDLILVSGIKVKAELIEAGIGRDQQFLVVRPGITQPNVVSKSYARHLFSISEEEIVVGWLGRVAQIKRPDRIIELALEFPDITFLIGGDGELFDEIKTKSPSNMCLAGWTTPSLLWSASDIALLTSENEAQPISLIEAASLKLPLIGEDVGSVSEVIKDGISGYLTNNLEQRIRAIAELSSQPKMRSKMGEMAFKDFKDLFSVGQFIDSHREAYSLVVSQGGR